jgi:diguanylate cyclase (GGDEF)-like protein/PAS domain S-box-containing protein
MESSKHPDIHYRLLFSENKAVMLLINPDDGTIVDASKGACLFYGYSYSRLTKMTIHVINTLSDAETIAEMHQAQLDSKNHFAFQHRLASGEIRDVEVYSNSILVNDQKFLFSVIHDITERRQAEEKIRQLALTDQLTGVANRRAFKQRMQQSIKLAKREGKVVALMSLDLDKFKPVNDTYGHLVGDAVLMHVASIFNMHSRDTDTVARIGGDEFEILVVHPESKAGVGQSAQRIIDEFKKTMQIEGHSINIGVSIGIALYPEDANAEDELMKKSDLALYEVKKRGSGSFLFYQPEMST